jgi:hypothetical protein
MKTRLNSKAAYEALINAPMFPMFGEARIPKSSKDYGDDKTVGLCLKRKNVNVFKGDPDNNFGIFLGKQEDKFIVGISKLGSKFDFTGCETFDDFNEMVSEWVLD